jgi:hypothetical protein
MHNALRFTPLLAIIAVLGVNAAANLVPINDMTTGQLSAMYPTGFTPSGWVFRIWSLIYLGLLAFAIMAIWGPPAIRQRAAAIAPLFLVNSAGNIGWIFAWHYEQLGLSLALMGLILATLVAITARLRRMPRRGAAAVLLVDAPFSLYFGWITTASLANLGNWFYDLQAWPFGLAMDEWALVTVVAASAVYVWMTTVTRDLVYGAVFVWVAAGIYLRPENIVAAVQLAAATGGALVVIAMLAAALWPQVRRA